ncbi:MAG: cobyrinate a,c-diamide synthase [Rhodospirillales bacterium]
MIAAQGGARGLILAAPASGCGKTTVTLGLLRHLKRTGVRAASAKAGPDYIDPAFHAAAGGRDCLNLDSWAMRRETIAATLALLARDAEAILCEGAMGLFDGAGPANAGSTAELAAILGWPVVLVVDIARQSASAAALVAGFAAHRPDVTVAGVILNRAASAGHAEAANAAIADAVPRIRRLGFLPRDGALALPERHLGLVQAGEHATLDRFLDAAADAVGAHVDARALIDLARPAPLPAPAPEAPPPLPRLGRRIAVARDAAFSFAYPQLLEGWRREGATLTFFSPLGNEAPEGEADAVYLPGGYPELHAGRLAAAGNFRAGVRTAAARGATVYGECGGYMTLGSGLVDREGRRYAMLGLLKLESSFAHPKLHLGYRRAALAGDTALGKAGQALRGHEFHYASAVDEGPGDPLFHLSDASGRALGSAGRVARHGKGLVMGSFAHLIDRE